MFKDGLCNLEKCAQHPQVIKALHKVLILVLMQFPRSCCGGPCEHTAYNMSAATASDKKAFEATVSPMVNMRMIPKCHALQFLCQCHVRSSCLCDMRMHALYARMSVLVCACACDTACIHISRIDARCVLKRSFVIIIVIILLL